MDNKGRGQAGKSTSQGTRKEQGDEAEARALVYLQRQGLRLVERNYRVALGPRVRAGEVDLILSLIHI